MATGDHGNPRCPAARPRLLESTHLRAPGGASRSGGGKRGREAGGRSREAADPPAEARARGRRSGLSSPHVNPSARQPVPVASAPIPPPTPQLRRLRLSSAAGAGLQPPAAANHCPSLGPSQDPSSPRGAARQVPAQKRLGWAGPGG